MNRDKGYVEGLRMCYPVGSRVVLAGMGDIDDTEPIEDGTRGTVVRVDDDATIYCLFDNCRFLGLIPGIDDFYRILETPCKEGEFGEWYGT